MVRLPPKKANYITQTIRDTAQATLANLERICAQTGRSWPDGTK